MSDRISSQTKVDKRGDHHREGDREMNNPKDPQGGRVGSVVDIVF